MASNISSYWNTYLQLANNRTMYLSNNNRNPVVKSEYVTADYRNYVTQYFEAQASQNVTLEQALLSAFQQIVDMIVLQSVYYPTEIDGGSADLGGYVTFRDELGEYMDVRAVKGFLFEDADGHQILHTGAALAKNFVPGGGELGSPSNPQPLGDELVASVKERLGIEDTLTARELLNNAYFYGQLSYEDDNNFSNYIGWYGDANGKFVDFWHEGNTVEEEAAAKAKGAKFIYKSYGYLGEVNADLGIKASDMMHTVIRVRKTIADDVVGSAVGKIVVEGAIPASLIPTITYEVALNGKTYESGVNSVTVTDTSAEFPARILYEVGLREDINPINIAEKVNANHKNNEGIYTFYTNDWVVVDYEHGAIADTSINAFTHFEPSQENERYYYLTDSVVYQDAQGTPYTGASKPTGDGYYHEYLVFSVTGEFHFQAFEMTDDTFTVKKSDIPVATATNVGAEPNGQGVAEAEFRFSNIEHTAPGVYYYQISEVATNGERGITSDDTVYNLTVTVTDDLQGGMNADFAMKTAANQPAAGLLFVNEYEPTPIAVNLTGDKLLNGRVLQAGEFEFGLFKATVGANDVWTAGNQVGQNVTNADNGDIAFPQLSFTEAGVYRYIAKEIGGQLGGVAYDDTQYRITVTVTDNHRGVLSAETVIVSDEGDALQSVTNAADGSVKFASIPFDTVGTYKYIVVEQNDAQKNYTYDDTVWCVAVEVTDNGEGQLVAETAIFEEGETKTVSGFTFENVYKPAAPKTGDTSNITLWFALLFVSCTGFVCVMLP